MKTYAVVFYKKMRVSLHFLYWQNERVTIIQCIGFFRITLYKLIHLFLLTFLQFIVFFLKLKSIHYSLVYVQNIKKKCRILA